MEINRDGLLSMGFGVPKDILCNYIMDIGTGGDSFYIKLRKSENEGEYSVELEDYSGNSVFLPTKMSSMGDIKSMVVGISSKKYF